MGENQRVLSEEWAEGSETPVQIKSSYQFVRCLGEGSQGKTYLAEKLDSGELVAVKELKMNSTDAFKGFELFMRESEVLADLDDPGVPKFYERIIPKDGNGSCYIVQEYIDHRSIQKELDLFSRSDMAFDSNDVLDIIESVGQILLRLEKNYVPAIVHRDIKPSNILWQKSGNKVQCWLIDFGAVANPQKRSASSTIAGTSGYMAPEQFMGECSPASDIYSLGMTAVHLLTGVPPWSMPVKGLRIEYEDILRAHRPFLGKEYLDLLQKMTAVSLEDRIKDAYELLHHPILFSRMSLEEKKNIFDEKESIWEGKAIYVGLKENHVFNKIAMVVFGLFIILWLLQGHYLLVVFMLALACILLMMSIYRKVVYTVIEVPYVALVILMLIISVVIQILLERDASITSFIFTFFGLSLMACFKIKTLRETSPKNRKDTFSKGSSEIEWPEKVYDRLTNGIITINQTMKGSMMDYEKFEYVYNAESENRWFCGMTISEVPGGWTSEGRKHRNNGDTIKILYSSEYPGVHKLKPETEA